MNSTADSKLLVLLECDEEHEALDWKLMNDSWISAEPARTCVLSFSTGQLRCSDLATGEAVDPGREAGDILLCSVKWNLAPKWREPIRRASSLFAVKSVTGRRLVEALGDGSKRLDDQTPALVARHVREWNVSAQIQGVECSCLPHDLLWISGQARPALGHCLSMASSLGHAIEHFYDEDMMPRNFGKNLYISDVVAFHR